MSIHARLGVAVVIVAAAGCLLVLAARARPSLLPTVRVFVRLCAVAATAEAAVGLVLLASGSHPGQAIHYFYGAATVIPVPAAELLARRGRDEWWLLLAGILGMALFGLRAITTGAG